TGRHITAAEAKEYGLIGHVVPDGDALDKALELAELVNANGPLAVQAMLRTMRATEGMHEEVAFAIDAKEGLPVFLSRDAKEGPRAFAEKRAPVFEGR
ncbi:enoyl-CoA hydratase-related protein, partial [Tsukamurella paurometabola]